MRRVILLAAFLASCGEGQEQTGPVTVVSPRPNVTGTWEAELSGDGFLTSDTAFIATMSAIAEFRFTQSGNMVSGDYAVEGTISTLDPDGAAFSFPLIAAGPVDGELTPADPLWWSLIICLRSFSGGADDTLTISLPPGNIAVPAIVNGPSIVPSISGVLGFEVGEPVHEGRTYHFDVTGTPVRLQ